MGLHDSRCLGMMCRIEGRMDHYMYREILEQELIHTLHAYNLDHANLIFNRIMTRNIHPRVCAVG